MTGVAVCQLAPVVGDVAASTDRALAAVAEAAGRGAEVVVLPELVTTGYVFHDADELRSLAEPLDGRSTSALVAASETYGVVLVAGVAECVGEDVFNSAVVASGGDLLATYRKVHLWDLELGWFTPGDAPPPVVDTPVGRVGVCVCYDLEFPEWLRLLGIGGADLVCAPTNWPVTVPVPPGERPVEQVRAQASASVEQTFLAVCDRVGHERGVDWVGGSVVVGPDGYPLARASEPVEQVLVADCDLAASRRKETSERNHPHRDRRPDLYSTLL